MRQLGKRGWVLLAMGLFVVPMSVASLAYACTGLATISTSPGSGVAGSTVTVNAKGFAAHDPSDARTSPAEIRMDSMTGPVIGTASPSSSRAGGNFSVQITVPNVDPGEHVLIATQNGTDGRPSYGTPARTVFKVDPTPAPPAAAAAAPPAPAPAVSAAPAAVVSVAPAQDSPKVSSPSKPARLSLGKAIASCNRQFNVNKAKTKKGKRRTAARRSACIKRARAART